MERLFPLALLECMRDNRLPGREDLEIMADKIGREAFEPRLQQGERRRALYLAQIALSGQPLAA